MISAPPSTRERLLSAALDLLWEHSYGATSVDDICARAGVKKGSFYHFFESKAELAIACLEAGWATRRLSLDAIFSPLVPPLQRLERHIALLVAEQEEKYNTTGCVCGCPLFSLGSEAGMFDEGIRQKVREVLDCYVHYYESALREAGRQGLVSGDDPAETARMLGVFIEGTLTQARILNDLTPVRRLWTRMQAILGLPRITPVTASPVGASA